MKSKFKDNIVALNHEFVVNMEADKVIAVVRELLKFTNFSHVEATDLDLYNDQICNDFEHEVLARM